MRARQGAYLSSVHAPEATPRRDVLVLDPMLATGGSLTHACSILRDRNPGRLISQRQLLQEVWGPRYGQETNYLRVFMAQIRRKLEPDPSNPRYFITESGMGYRFVRDGTGRREQDSNSEHWS